jgi:hypothetical protein
VLYPRLTHKTARVERMTAQVHELLILDGQWTSIASDPPLPANHARVVAASEEHRRKASSIVNSTACWRGYIATWQIKDDRFYLVSIEGRFELVGIEPLLADWFTGELRVPMGEVIDYVHMGFASVFAEELFVRIVNGAVVSRRRVDNRGKR